MKETVRRHAEMMEYKIDLNEAEKGDSWKEMPTGWLLKKLNEEIGEFKKEARKKRPNITSLALEGADVSNIIMFITENARNKWAERSAEKMFGKG